MPSPIKVGCKLCTWDVLERVERQKRAGNYKSPQFHLRTLKATVHANNDTNPCTCHTLLSRALNGKTHEGNGKPFYGPAQNPLAGEVFPQSLQHLPVGLLEVYTRPV